MAGSIQTQRTAVIANGATVSASIYCGNKVAVALQMPAAFTGTTITFQGSYDGTTFQAVNVGGAAYSETVAASLNIALDATVLAGFRYLKVVSGSAEGAARSVLVNLRRGDS